MAMHKIGGGISLLGGAGLGALMMYLFDPEEGPGRRKAVGSAADRVFHGASDTLAGAWSEVSRHAGDLGASLSHHASHLADGASDIGHRAGEAIDPRAALGAFTDEISSRAPAMAKAARRIGQHLTDRAGDYANRAKRAARGYASDANDMAHSYFHTESSSSDAVGYTMTAVGAVALGLGAMYMLDPTEGKRRRKMVINKVNDIVSQTGECCLTTGQHLRKQFDQLAEHFHSNHRNEGGKNAGQSGGAQDNSAFSSGESNAGPDSGAAGEDQGLHFHWNPATRIGVGVAGGALGFYGAVRHDWVGLGTGLLGLGLIAAGVSKYDFTTIGDDAAQAYQRVRDRASQAGESLSSGLHGTIEQARDMAGNMRESAGTLRDSAMSAGKAALDSVTSRLGGNSNDAHQAGSSDDSSSQAQEPTNAGATPAGQI